MLRKMPKILKYIITGLLIFVLLCAFAEVGLRYKEYIDGQKYANEFASLINSTKGFNEDNTKEYNNGTESFIWRNPEKKDTDTAILLTGCSFFFGDELQYKDTAGKILSDYTGRTVYNLALNGGAPQDFLYVLEDDDAFDNAIDDKNVKITDVIYIWIDEQKPRFFCNLHRKIPAYKFDKKSNILTYYKAPYFLYKSKLYFKILEKYAYYMKKKPETFNLAIKYFQQMKKDCQKRFGDDVNFTVLVYQDDDYDDWEKAKNAGINVLKFEEMADSEVKNKEDYTVWDNWHPSGELWKFLVPKISEKLNLK